MAAMSRHRKPKPITTKHLAATLSEQHELTKKQGQEMIDDLIGMITKHLKKGERVKIAGLGVLQVRKRAARMGRNPATGEPIQIKASQEGRLPRRQRPQDGDLTAFTSARKTPAGTPAGFLFARQRAPHEEVGNWYRAPTLVRVSFPL